MRYRVPDGTYRDSLIEHGVDQLTNLRVLLARPARLRTTLRHPVVISGVLFGLVLVLRVWLQWIGPFPGDRYGLAHFNAVHPGAPTDIIVFYTAIGEPFTVVVTLVIGTWAVWRRIGHRQAVGFVLAMVVIVWNAILKVIFGPTPLWQHVHGAGVNFPSGHTSYVTAAFGYLWWLGTQRRELELIAVCALIVVGMGPERVVSGSHPVSDVVGGYLLGLAWLIVTVTWVKRDPQRRQTATQSAGLP